MGLDNDTVFNFIFVSFVEATISISVDKCDKLEYFSDFHIIMP